jgi:hypothetical protein
LNIHPEIQGHKEKAPSDTLWIEKKENGIE